MEVKEKPECPEARKSWYNGTRLCQLEKGAGLQGKICLLEEGETCDHYEEWLKEEQNNVET